MATTVRTLQNFIGGEWVESTGDSGREIVSPVTGEKLADAPSASNEDLDRAVAAARSAQPKWAALSAWDRAAVCHAIADAKQIMADAGLPEGVVNAIYGAGDVGEALVTHPGIDCIGFIGSHGRSAAPPARGRVGAGSAAATRCST